MRAIGKFMRSVWGHWVTTLSGTAASLVGLVWQVAQWVVPNLRGPAFQPWMLVMLGVALLALAVFWAWRDEHDRANRAEAEITQLKDKSPIARLSFSCDQTGWARLKVTNEGAGALFWATIQTYGLTAGAVEGRQVYARWEEVDGSRQFIGRGDTKVLRLATVTQRQIYSKSWNIHRADEDHIPGVEKEEIIDVVLVAEPDLREPCKVRIHLHADGESEMATL
jgi:hypothetical protein